MRKHRSYPIEFKRQVAQEYLAGETLHGLAKRHEINRNLVRIWVAKYEAGSFDSDVVAADIVQTAGSAHRRAGAPGRQARARERVFKGGLARRTPGREARLRPSSPAPWSLGRRRMPADGARAVDLL